MSGEAQNLTRALKGDKKLVGNWGEAQVEKTLELAGLRRGNISMRRSLSRTSGATGIFRIS